MSTTAATAPAVRDDRTTPAPRRRRAWAVTGLAAGLSGIGAIMASSAVTAVYDEQLAGDLPAIVAALRDQTTAIVAFHTLTMVSALLLLVFAAGLKRRLDEQAPAGSLHGTVAAMGLALVSVAGLIGSGMTTELVFGVRAEEATPEPLVLMGHWMGTIPWLWAGAGVAAAAVAVAALRHGAAARWLGWVSAVFGVVTLGFAVIPLQYMTGFVGPVWLTVAAIGFLAGDRR